MTITFEFTCTASRHASMLVKTLAEQITLPFTVNAIEQPRPKNGFMTVFEVTITSDDVMVFYQAGMITAMIYAYLDSIK